MSWLFASGGQSIGASAPITSNEYSEFISFRNDWFDPLAVQGTLKSLIQHHSLNASVLWHSAFFMVQLLHPYMTTRKTITDYVDLCQQSDISDWSMIFKTLNLLNHWIIESLIWELSRYFMYLNVIHKADILSELSFLFSCWCYTNLKRISEFSHWILDGPLEFSISVWYQAPELAAVHFKRKSPVFLSLHSPCHTSLLTSLVFHIKQFFGFL